LHCPAMHSPRPQPRSPRSEAAFEAHKAKAAEVLGGSSGSLLDFAYKPMSPVIRPAGDQMSVRDRDVDTISQSELSGVASNGMASRAFIAEQFAGLRASLVSEVRNCHMECLAAVQVSHSRCMTEVLGMRRMMESHHMEQDTIHRPPTPTETTSQKDDDKSLLHKAKKKEAENTSALEKAERKYGSAIEDFDDDMSLYRPIVKAAISKKGIWHKLLDAFCTLPYGPPDNILAKFCENYYFVLFQTLAILINTAIMGFEADATIKAALQRHGGRVPEWVVTCNLVFNIIFILELAFRIFALRVWFLISPNEWGWNVFDFFIVCSSIVTDFAFQDINLSFLRTLRMLRAVRAVRVIRVLKFFRHLRKMLFSILASLASLIWFLLFLAMLMYMTSILLLQGLSNALDDMADEWFLNSEQKLVQEYYGSVTTSMYTLLAAVSGGSDWMLLEEPLRPAGYFYRTAFVAYILFVTIGVINVLTGIFLESNADFEDTSLVVVEERKDIEREVVQMLEVFQSLDRNANGKVTWNTFQLAMKDDYMQAYLSSHKVKPAHALMTYQIMDEKNEGEIDAYEIIMGMLRLKGEAKTIDARILMRQLSKMERLLEGKLKGPTWDAFEEYIASRPGSE